MHRESPFKIKRMKKQSDHNFWSRSRFSLSESAKERTLFDYKSKNLPNSRLQSQVEWKYLIFESLFCFFTSLNIILIYFLMSDDFREERNQALSICSYFTMISVVFYCFKGWNQMRMEKLTHKQGNNFQKSLFLYFFGICFNLVHPCFITEGWLVETAGSSLKVNDLLCIVLLMKGWRLAILAIKCTRFHGSRVARVLQIYAVKDRAGLKYPLKSIFKAHGLRLSFTFLIFCVILLTLSKMVLAFAEGKELNLIAELYDTVISLATVGYGDIDHQSSIGRVGMGIFVFLAIFATSLLTLATVNFFTLRQVQLKSLTTLRRLQLNQQIRLHRKETIRGLITGQRRGGNIEGFQRQLSEWKSGYSFTESYKSELEILERAIKRVIQKQLLIDGLMDFYLSRGEREQQERSKRSRKDKESEKVARLFDSILSMNE